VTRPAHADPFPPAFALDTHAGRCIAVRLPPAEPFDRAGVLAALHPEERALAEGFRGARLIAFAGGRVAARRAGGAEIPTLRGPDGAPVRAGGRVSISHSRRLAVALVADGTGLHPGVDVEPLAPDPADHLLAERILAPEERDDASLPLVARLSLKEAAFKALHPLLGPVAFRRIVVLAGRNGGLRLEVPAAVRLAAALRYVEDHVLGVVAVSPEAPRRAASSAPAASPTGIQKVSHIQSVGVRTRS